MAKHPGGRPTKYKKEYCAAIVAYFSVQKHSQYIKKEIIKQNGMIEREYALLAADLPTFEGFARLIKVNGDTVVEWAKATKEDGKTLKYPEFSAAYNTAKHLQKEFLIDNGLKGLYPPASFIFVAKNVTDLRDKQETDITSGGEKLGVIYLPHRDQGILATESGSPDRRPDHQSA
jgi:hypothetical protein